MRFLGSIDQGTTSSRFLIFTEEGEVVASHQEEFDQIFPQAGWVEHDPMAILNSVLNSMNEAVKKFLEKGYQISDLKAIGITNQRETTLCWDCKTGKPLYNAIVWNDTRTKALVKKLAQSSPSKSERCLVDQCGLPLSTYFSALKLKWMLENVEEVSKAAKDGTLKVGTVDSWLIYNLTGGINQGIHVTDVTNASRTMLMDIKTLQWSENLCNFFEFQKTWLPKIKSSAEVYGHVATGELKGIPLAGCLGDQQAALVGHRCFNPGQAKNTYGTGCFMVYNTGEELVFSQKGLLTTVAYQFGSNNKPAYALEGSIAVAGSAIKWLRDSLGLIKETQEINEYAARVEDTGGVYFVTAFSGLFAPYWRDDARGCIVGLTQYVKKEHICRAALEAACFQTKDVADAMVSESGHPLQLLKVDGGMTNSSICMQIQADLLGIPVVRPKMVEITALGSAFAAGVGVGIWKSVEDLEAMKLKEYDAFQPKIPEEVLHARFKGWARAVEKSFDSV